MGALRCGLEATLRNHAEPDDAERFDVAVFYGMSPEHKKVWQAFKAAGRKTIIMDLAYWDRTGTGHGDGRFDCSYKVAVDHWHPTAYFQRRPMPDDRLRRYRVQVEPDRHPPGVRGYILLVGMSRKGCDLYDIPLLSWERAAVEALRATTERPIVYRPKAAVRGAGGLPGTTWQDPSILMGHVLRREPVYAVVSHHSNAAVEAIALGIPVVVADGAALALSGDLRQLYEPRYAPWNLREQFCRDLAYCQWNIAEMRLGLPWKHLLMEGLLAV